MPIRVGAELESAGHLATRELADLLHVSLWGLMRWRCDGYGPPFLRLGRNSVRYPRVGLQAWLRALGHKTKEIIDGGMQEFQGSDFQPCELR